jgi:hypothetical protein
MNQMLSVCCGKLRNPFSGSWRKGAEWVALSKNTDLMSLICSNVCPEACLTYCPCQFHLQPIHKPQGHMWSGGWTSLPFRNISSSHCVATVLLVDPGVIAEAEYFAANSTAPPRDVKEGTGV